MKKKKNKKLTEERCFKKDIEIQVTLQNLKWYITDENVHDDQAITMNAFHSIQIFQTYQKAYQQIAIPAIQIIYFLNKNRKRNQNIHNKTNNLKFQ